MYAVTPSPHSPADLDAHHFAVGPRYRPEKTIGKGSHGTVVSAFDTTTGGRVAIKKIALLEHQVFCQRTLREIKILTRFKHENIIEILAILHAPSVAQMKDIYIVQPLMETDLHKLLKQQKLSAEHMSLILEVLGSPTDDDLRCIHSEKTRRWMCAQPHREKQPLSRRYPLAELRALELIDRMLTFDPQKRVTVDEALAHPYLKQYHDPDDEPICEQPFTAEVEFDHLPVHELKRRIFEESAKFAEQTAIADGF
ncbi:Protein kinase domain-containing protein [Aphelenchoides fujianensis]|nr:Protein kinase domain-containing protein [Aphelenchoides fujianensis]